MSCDIIDCSDLAMILCDSQAVEVLAITIMKILQQCSTSDLLPRVGVLFLQIRKLIFLNFQTSCTLCDADRVNIVIYATVFVCVNEKDLFVICCWNFFLWSPYVIGQTIIFSSCFFLLLSSFFFFFA